MLECWTHYVFRLYPKYIDSPRAGATTYGLRSLYGYSYRSCGVVGQGGLRRRNVLPERVGALRSGSCCSSVLRLLGLLLNVQRKAFGCLPYRGFGDRVVVVRKASRVINVLGPAMVDEMISY